MTNTPHALKLANDEVWNSTIRLIIHSQVYAKLPDNSRPRFTILFTDGAPFGYYTPFENITDYGNLSKDEAKKHLMNVSTEIRKLYTADTESREERIELQNKLAGLITPDIQREVRKMRDTHSEMHKRLIIFFYIFFKNHICLSFFKMLKSSLCM